MASGLGARFSLFEIFSLNKIEVIQHADPDDTGQYVKVTKEKLNIRHAYISWFLVKMALKPCSRTSIHYDADERTLTGPKA
jgi:hypothetical protein